MSKLHPPMNASGLAGIACYFNETARGRDADPNLLLAGLPQGRVRSAEVLIDPSDGSKYIAFVLRDQSTGLDRNPRYLDVAGWLVKRLLLLPKTHIRIDKNVRRPEGDLHYVALYQDNLLQRLIANAGANQQARLIGDHHDLRRRNLAVSVAVPSATLKPVHQDRALAIATALANFDTAAGHLDHLPITREIYAAMLADAFALLDRLPLGSTVKLAEAAE
jgi:hypothetical protein